MYRFRYIIAELHDQLASLHNPMADELVVYRGQLISTKELQILQKKNKDGNGFISIQTFLSTTADFGEAVGFAQIGFEGIPLGLESIVLVITVKETRIPHACIDKLSAMPKEKEILFSVGTVFYIDNIEQHDHGYLVYLTLTTEIEQKFDALSNFLLEGMGESSHLHQLVSFLINKGDYLLAETYCQRILNECDLTSDENMRLLCYFYLANSCLNRSDLTQAMYYLQKGLSIGQQIFDDQNNIFFSISYVRISEILKAMGRFDEALEYTERALSIAVLAHPQDREILSSIHNQLGEAYREQRDYSKALNNYELSLKYDVEIPQHTNLSTTYCNMGHLYTDLNQYETAIAYFRKAQIIQKASLPPEHSAHGLCERGLGDAYLGSGDYHQALQTSQSALDCALREVPTDFSSVANGYTYLGRIYKASGDYLQAESSCKKALQFYGKKLCTPHPCIAQAQKLLGEVYQDMGERKKALSNYKRALNIHKQQNLPDLFEVADILTRLGDTTDNLSKGIQYHEQAISTLLSSKSQDLIRADLALTYIGLGCAYVKAKRKNDDVLAALRLAEAIGDDLAKQDMIDPQLSSIFNNLGVAFASINTFSKALECVNRALEIDLQTYHVLHPKIGLNYRDLASIYEGAKMYEHALDLYEKAANVFRRDKSKNRELLAKIYKDMGEVYYELKEGGKELECSIMELELRLQCSQPNDRALAECYENIGLSDEAQNKFTSALAYFVPMFQIQVNNLLPFDPELAEASRLVGGNYSSTNRHNLAVKYFYKALEIQRRRKLPLVSTYLQLADEYKALKKSNKALKYYQLAMKHLIKEDNESKSQDYYEELSSLYCDISSIEWHLKQFKKAINNLKLSQSIQEDFLRDDEYKYLRNKISQALNTTKKDLKKKSKWNKKISTMPACIIKKITTA